MLFTQDITKELDPFERIDLHFPAKTSVEFGDRFYIEVDGRERDLKELDIDVHRNTLVIESKRSSFFRFNHNHQQVRIRIVTKSLTRVDVGASGHVELPEFNQKSLDLNLNGSADVFLSGAIKDLRVDKSGSGDLEITKLIAEHVDIERSGSGNIDIDGTTDVLSVDASGSGELNWKGIEADKISISASGSGSYDFSGETDVLDIELSGSGGFEGDRFTAQRLKADLHGSSDVRLRVEKELDARTSGSGDISYRGEPKIVRKKESGSGDIRRY